MKKIFILVACGSLILLGCSKSNKSQPQANNGNSSAASGSAPAGPVDLKIKWQTGKHYDMKMDLNQTTDINQQDLKLSQTFSFSPLKDLDHGGHLVRLQFDSQNLSLTQNGREIVSYDSTQKTHVEPNNPAAPMAAAIQAMAGAPLDYTFAADGTVEKIDGIDALASRITAAVPNERQRMALQQLYDENTLKQYGAFAQGLPDHPVNVGDTWSLTRDVTTPIGVATVDITFTFKDWEQRNGHNCVHLLMTGDIKTKTSSASRLGAVVKIDKGTIKGDNWFDPDLGMLVDSASETDMTLNITTRERALTADTKRNVELSLVDVN